MHFSIVTRFVLSDHLQVRAGTTESGGAVFGGVAACHARGTAAFGGEGMGDGGSTWYCEVVHARIFKYSAVLLLALGALNAQAQEVTPNCADEACVVAHGRFLLETEQYENAIAFLNASVEAFPESGSAQVLLGIAHLEAGYPLWAVDTLTRRLDQDRADCEARIWLAWAYIRLAVPAEALGLLSETDCVDDGPTGTRVAMIRALAAMSVGEEIIAREHLSRARQRELAYLGDRRSLRDLTRLILPERLQHLSWRLTTAFGYATNALMGSPSDPALAGVEPESMLFQGDALIRVIPELTAIFRPLVEFQVKVLRFLAEDAKEQSYLQISGRAGFYLDWGLPRFLVTYRPEFLQIAGGDGFEDGPVWYVSAHRGEIEAEITSWLLAFAGGGHRDFRELGRTRAEADGGLGGQVSLIERLALLWAAMGRKHWARDDSYDLVGASLIANLQYPLTHGWLVRGGFAFGVDWYPESEGFFADEARRDLFIRPSALILSPAFHGVRAGLSYEYSDRDSTAPKYGFSDHRISFQLRWFGATDFGLPSRAQEDPYYELDWGLDDGSGTSDRIQDLLRQDDQLRQSCGCVE